MQMIPSLILQHMASPKKIENMFIAYIKAAKLPIDASKTIAGVAYFHKQNFGLDKSATFFSGTFDKTLTNVPGNSFIRPASEHLLIWAVRIQTALGLQPTSTIYTPGVDLSAFLAALQMTITTNSDVKLKDFPLMEALSDLTVRDNGIIPLAEPIFWGGQQDMKVEMINGDDVVSAGQDNLWCGLIGMGLI